MTTRFVKVELCCATCAGKALAIARVVDGVHDYDVMWRPQGWSDDGYGNPTCPSCIPPPPADLDVNSLPKLGD